jgi:hypothetical protein
MGVQEVVVSVGGDAEPHARHDGFQFRIPVRALVHIHMSAGAIRGTQNLEEVTMVTNAMWERVQCFASIL